MVKKWWYLVLLFLFPYSLLAYKVNLDCNGDATGADVTVTLGESVSCNFLLEKSDPINNPNENIGGISAYFNLHTNGLPASFSSVSGYSLSDNLAIDDQSAFGSYYGVVLTDTDTNAPVAFPFPMASLNIAQDILNTVGNYIFYLEIPVGGGFTGGEYINSLQECDSTDIIGDDLALCTNAYLSNPVMVAVGEVSVSVDSDVDGVPDNLEPSACVGKGSVGLVYASQPDLQANVLGCPYGDLNGDGCVNFEDVELIAPHVDFACDATNPQGKTADQGDINSDGCVNFNDVELISLNVDFSCGS